MVVDGIKALLTGQVGDVDLSAFQSQIETVTGLVGQNVYESALPRGYSLPAVAVHRYNGSQDYDMDGPIGIREDLVQADCYGRTADERNQVSEAVRALLQSFVGTLPDADATVVQACFLIRDTDLPFMPNASANGQTFPRCLGFRVVSEA